jgi:hypothetical protein
MADLNKWEYENINVLTSLEMGAWLARRETRILTKIKEEVENIKDFEVVNGGLYVRLFDAVEILEKHMYWKED